MWRLGAAAPNMNATRHCSIFLPTLSLLDMRYKELDISIQVDGRTLEEFETTVNEPEKTVTCWVASEAGKVD